jgi:hypothetical protein
MSDTMVLKTHPVKGYPPKKRQHNWTYLPELGPGWAWCPLCNRAKIIGNDDQLYAYRQALQKITQERTG